MRLSFESLLPGVDRNWKNLRTNCGLRHCPNTLFMRSVQSRVGITVGDVWYCGPDCLAGSASLRFQELLSTNVVEMPHNPRMSIGLVMLSKGYLTDSQLRMAMAQSHANGQDLETVLMQQGLASERQLTAARAAQWGYPVLGQERMGLVTGIDLPATLLQNCWAAPLHCSPTAKRLLLGFVYRVDHSLMNALEQMTGFRAQPCFITPTEFAEQTERLASLLRYEEEVFEDLKTPMQMGKTVGGLAVEIGARDVRFSHCRDFAWTRLVGKRRSIDVLFRIKGEQASEKSTVSTGVRSAG